MFDSGITAKDFVAALIEETDIAPDIPVATFYSLLSELEQLLYSEIIKEVAVYRAVWGTDEAEDGSVSVASLDNMPTVGTCAIDLDEIPVADDTAAVRYEDVYAVHFAPDTSNDNVRQLFRSTAVGGAVFDYTFWAAAQNAVGELISGTSIPRALCFNVADAVSGVFWIYYRVRPVIKTVDNCGEQNVKLPFEFLPLARAKIRGEIYKIVNEDSVAAKWINDYNVLLENFKQYIASREPEFGV